MLQQGTSQVLRLCARFPYKVLSFSTKPEVLGVAGQRAYGGLTRDVIIDRVYRKKVRPQMPSGVPKAYAALCAACWEQEGAQRPSFATILLRLGEMSQQFRSSSKAAGSASELQQVVNGHSMMPTPSMPLSQPSV
jgi:hypothetical protein